MEHTRALPADSGLVLAPIHSDSDGTPLRVCVLVRSESDPVGGTFVLLREVPGAQIYLGAVCDAAARIQDWVEIWVQGAELRDLVFSGYEERLTNFLFDQRWQLEHQTAMAAAPQKVIITGMEAKNPTPIAIKRRAAAKGATLVPSEPSTWRLCQDDALLDSFGLPRYSTSPYRYLYEPGASGAKTFVATTPDAPTNSHVQGLERLRATPDVTEIFNPHAGLIRVARFEPLGLDDYLQVLEGRPWQGRGPGAGRWFEKGVYAELEKWSAKPQGMPFLLHGPGTPAERLNEIFFLKASVLLGMFREVRAYIKKEQLPLLNLSPASFSVHLPEVGEQFPAFWPAECLLVKPGQAHPLKIKSTEQKYFLRLGKIEPSPFLPEALGANSFGIGSVRRRNVLTEADGTVLEGTLVAEDYLRLDPNDLLWFKLPVGDERVELYAHVYTAEAVGPREARFRTVPTKLSDSVVATLKSTGAFAKAPYEVWPLLSSPCDLHSLGIISIRALLANSQSNLPVIVDDVLGLARHIGKDLETNQNLAGSLKAVLEKEPKLLDLVSPHSLVEREWSAAQAREQIQLGLWLETVAWLLRLFPGAGTQSYCKDFGDVSPLALETIFDAPIQALEQLCVRLRSILAPTTAANEEIASTILEQLSAV
jgi:hypothetical protein